jgi:hypothetical protein
VQRSQQAAGEDHPLPAPLGKALSFEEFGALLHSLLDIIFKPKSPSPRD